MIADLCGQSLRSLFDFASPLLGGCASSGAEKVKVGAELKGRFKRADAVGLELCQITCLILSQVASPFFLPSSR